MKNWKKLLAITTILAVTVLGCTTEEKDSSEVALKKNGENTKLISTSDILGLEFEVNEAISQNDLGLGTDYLCILKEINGKTKVSIAKKGGQIAAGEEIALMNTAKIAGLTFTKILTNMEMEAKAIGSSKRSGETLLGDFDESGKIDIFDFNGFKNNYGSTNAKYDIGPAEKGTSVEWQDIYAFANQDGKVDLADLAVFSNNYGKTTPVVASLETISVSGKTSVYTDDNISLTVVGNYENGSTQNISSDYTVESSDTTVVSVSGTTLNAAGEGTATITITYKGKTDTISITVSDKPIVVTGDKYATNPNGQYGKYTTEMNVESSNMKSDGFTDWSEDMIIAQGVANDIAQSFLGSHEAPLYDTYTLYAAWDDDNLYLGWQFVNVVDVVDPAQGYPISDNGKPWNGDIPQILAFDLDASKSGDGTLEDGTGVWAASGKAFNLFENGLDALAMFSSKPGVGQPSLFFVNENGDFEYNLGMEADGKTPIPSPNVKLFKDAGVDYGYIDGLHTDITEVWGVNKPGAWAGYEPDDLLDGSNFEDMLTLGHEKTQDTFYEMKIPFEALGIDKNYLETVGIGVMHVSTFGESAIGSIPYDPAVYDNYDTPYGPDASSSGEKEDVDVFTAPMARIGK